MILFIIWLLLGVIAVWRTFHSVRKMWYDEFKEDYWKYPGSALFILLIFSPVFILGGLFTLLLMEFMDNVSKKRVWYFKIPEE